MILLFFLFILLCIACGAWGWPLVASILGLSSVSDKPSALKHIAQLMNTYDIEPAEIATAHKALAITASEVIQRDTGDIVKTLFTYLGAIFILAGIGTYTSMFWDTMGSIMRILVTLGVGYALSVVLVSSLHEHKFPKLILPLTIACVIMMTGGWFVLLHEVFPTTHNWRPPTLFVFATMALQLTALFYKYRRTVFACLALFFTYSFLHVGLDFLGVPVAYIAIVLGASLFIVGIALEKTPQSTLAEPTLLIAICWLNSGLFDQIASLTAENWASLVIGISIMLSAYGLQQAKHYPRFVGLGYFVGSIMLYCGLFDLVENTPIELLYFAVTASLLYICVLIQSRALLFTAVISMLSFIGYYSSEYFANSLGWPVTLVLMGVGFLSVGTIALKLKHRIKPI